MSPSKRAAREVKKMGGHNEETWAFNIGQRVTHRDQPMPSLVMARVRTSKGKEIYGVRRNEECEMRHLMILGEVLVPVSAEEAAALAVSEEAWFAAGEALNAPWRRWVENGAIESERPDKIAA